MKTKLFTLLGALFLVAYSNAQDVDFGLTAGYFNADAKLEVDGDNFDVDGEGGFYGGVVLDFSVSDKFGVRPELIYVNVNESSALFLPVMAKIGLVKGLHIQAGPQFGISLEEVPDDASSFDFDLAAGLGFDFPLGVFVEARYAFQVNNAYTGDLDILAKGRYLTFGVGFKF